MGLSGTSEEDIRLSATKLYESRKENGRFKFFDCWKVLRDEPKWQEWMDSTTKPDEPKVVKRPSSDQEVDLSSESDKAIQRPTGMKRAKSEKAQELLLVRQVRATEAMVDNAKARIQVAQEQNDIQVFSMRFDPSDEQAAEFLKLKRENILQRLRSTQSKVIDNEATV
ncbi:hypothetical protein AC1031_014700 [Aphanomyces cochlioides]|nr:hypothetical protein AC1031_014700 [Aphanomyces cochlioides]